MNRAFSARRLVIGGGSAGVSYIYYKNYKELKESKESVFDIPAWKVALFRTLPLNTLTQMTGYFVSLPVPVWLRKPIYGTFGYVYGCKLDECAPLASYRTFNEFFSRRLLPSARSIEKQADFVSPVDGQILAIGKLTFEDEEAVFPEQIKGVRYPLKRLLGTSFSDLRRDVNWNYCTIYLSPGSYHRFHCPVDGFRIEKVERFSGELLPVAPWALRWLPGLVSLNERAVINGTNRSGRMIMIPVGATNVGSIELAYEEGGAYLKKGEDVGTFKMGSFLVLLFESKHEVQWKVSLNDSVMMGQALGHSPKTWLQRLISW